MKISFESVAEALWFTFHNPIKDVHASETLEFSVAICYKAAVCVPLANAKQIARNEEMNIQMMSIY